MCSSDLGIVFNWHPSDVEDALGDEIKKDLHLDLGALSTSALGEVGIPAGWNLSQIDADPSTPLFTSLIPQGYSAVVRTIVPYSIPAEGILGALIKKDLDLDLGALSPTASGEVQLPAAWNLSQYDANPSTADVLDPLTPDGGRATVRTIVPLNGDKGRWQILTRNADDTVGPSYFLEYDKTDQRVDLYVAGPGGEGKWEILTRDAQGGVGPSYYLNYDGKDGLVDLSVALRQHPEEGMPGAAIKKDLALDLGALSSSELGEVKLPDSWDLSQIDADPTTGALDSLIPLGGSAIVRTIVTLPNSQAKWKIETRDAQGKLGQIGRAHV